MNVIPGSVLAKSLTASRVGPHWRDWQNAGVAKTRTKRLVLGQGVVLGDLVEGRVRVRVGRDLVDVTADIGQRRRRRVRRLRADGRRRARGRDRELDPGLLGQAVLRGRELGDPVARLAERRVDDVDALLAGDRPDESGLRRRGRLGRGLGEVVEGDRDRQVGRADRVVLLVGEGEQEAGLADRVLGVDEDGDPGRAAADRARAGRYPARGSSRSGPLGAGVAAPPQAPTMRATAATNAASGNARPRGASNRRWPTGECMATG